MRDNYKFKCRLIEEKDIIEIEEFYKLTGDDFNFSNLINRYSEPKTAYFIAEDENGNIVAGCGIGPHENSVNMCELQMMWVLEKVRCTKVCDALIKTCFDFAKKYYNSVYLENSCIVKNNREFYEFYGFKKIEENEQVFYLLKFKTVSTASEVFTEIFGELLGFIVLLGLGLLALPLLPDNCVEQLDIEGLMAVGGLLFIVLPCVLISLIALLFKRKDKKK